MNNSILVESNSISLSLLGNNKTKLESWLHFLTQSHTFASSGKIVSSNEKPKHALKLEGVSEAARKWINSNYNPLKRAPYHSVREWERVRPKPAVTVPLWQVRVNLDVAFKGTAEEARRFFDGVKQQPKTKMASLISPEDRIEEIWKREN
ncbi:hypothetical protein [Kamptonema sp. UHCC 0994]|uniref:hypothetical protein n=1 Tax=Kamptonema sp. UHCC 0994 TaxID=3031329 RepID=UPI0023BA32BC|nr:hypothetical protein [Kamptonema sp. UHCC 0994]MDF0553146.1 hypothetical protein [Kamptonema sp. UHCC 0994]